VKHVTVYETKDGKTRKAGDKAVNTADGKGAPGKPAAISAKQEPEYPAKQGA